MKNANLLQPWSKASIRISAFVSPVPVHCACWPASVWPCLYTVQVAFVSIMTYYCQQQQLHTQTSTCSEWRKLIGVIPSSVFPGLPHPYSCPPQYENHVCVLVCASRLWHIFSSSLPSKQYSDLHCQKKQEPICNRPTFSRVSLAAALWWQIPDLFMWGSVTKFKRAWTAWEMFKQSHITVFGCFAWRNVLKCEVTARLWLVSLLSAFPLRVR